ncbi:hypothetical protein [Xenorhabdus innexi]|nr:hypothetical protein [Xenorhabdus innexi]
MLTITAISHGKLSPRVSTSGADAITYNMRRAQIGMNKHFYENDQGLVVYSAINDITLYSHGKAT